MDTRRTGGPSRVLHLLTPPSFHLQNPALSEEAAGKPVLSLLDMDALKAMSTEE